jgi:hypothetical protein
MNRGPLRFFILLLALALAAAGAELTVKGTRFELDGKPFPYTGLSFFNAIYNTSFNQSREERLKWLARFESYGINVLRVWSQWDSKRGFADSCPACTLYQEDGSLRPDRLETLKQILADAESRGIVIELVLFSQESWRDGIKLPEGASEKAVRAVASELKPHRNLTIQIWNEFSLHTVPLVKIVKEVDPRRLVTSSPGGAGTLTAAKEETELMDYLTPHTSRQIVGKPWVIGPSEIGYLIARYGRPVVDDEPARNGTSSFGGPKEPTSPYDHIAQILNVWRVGGYPTYHHDMFQMGAGHPTVPPSGIPDPEFSPYHRVVFEFLKMRARYQ